MYSVRYEKTIPPWSMVGQDNIEAETSEDAVKEFYKRHDPYEVRATHVCKTQNTYQKNVM